MSGTTTPAADRTALNRLRAVHRLARRTVRANGWRGQLIVLLIALSVATATVTAIGARSTRVPESHVQAERLGAVADLRVDAEDGVTFDDLPPDLQAVYLAVRGVPPEDENLPPVEETVTTVLGDAPVLALHEDHTSGLRVLAVDLRDPLAAGLVTLRQAPPGPGEVLLSDAARARLAPAGRSSADDGDTVEIAGRTHRVAGDVAHPTRLGEALAVLPAGSLGDPDAWLVDVDDPHARQRLVDALVPATAQGVVPRTIEVRRDGIGEGTPARTAAVVRDVATDPSTVGAVVGALILLQVGLVAAAAFTTGTRRRIRERGLLGAAGASPAQVGHLLLAEGLVLGTAGAVAGAVLGVLTALPSARLMESVAQVPVSRVQVHPMDLLAPALVGVVAAALAARWPARTAARVPTTTALAGRVPQGRVPRWLPTTAVATTAVGLVLVALTIRAEGPGLLPSAVLLLAVLLTAAGAATVGVPLIGLGGHLAGRLGLRARLVMRDAARQRTRSGSTVAALVVVLLVPTVLLAGDATDRVRSAPTRPDVAIATVVGPHLHGLDLPVTDEMVAAVRDELPVHPVAQVELVALAPASSGPAGAWTDVRVHEVPGGAPVTLGGRVVLATDDLLDAVDLDPALRRGLTAGDVVVDVVPPDLLDRRDPGGVYAATVTAVRGEVPGRSVEVPLVTVASDVVDAPRTVVGAVLADDLELSVRVREVLLVLPRRLDPATELAAVYETPIPSGGSLYGDLGAHGPAGDEGVVGLGIALLVTLLVVGTAAALAATESDRDLSTMVAVGAPPTLRRAFHGLQAAYHTGLAAMIAVPVGLLLFRATQRASGHGLDGPPIVVPWPWLPVVLLGVPAVVGGVMWLLARPGRPVTARRPT